MEPTFFATPQAFRAWLEANHETATELSVGFRKRGTGLASITWPQAVDQALCFGRIDGIRHSIDGESYRIRFTPRRPKGIWSQVNIRRIEELRALGLVHPAGLVVRGRQGPHQRVFARTRRPGLVRQRDRPLPGERTGMDRLPGLPAILP